MFMLTTKFIYTSIYLLINTRLWRKWWVIWCVQWVFVYQSLFYMYFVQFQFIFWYTYIEKYDTGSIVVNTNFKVEEIKFQRHKMTCLISTTMKQKRQYSYWSFCLCKAAVVLLSRTAFENTKEHSKLNFSVPNSCLLNEGSISMEFYWLSNEAKSFKQPWWTTMRHRSILGYHMSSI